MRSGRARLGGDWDGGILLNIDDSSQAGRAEGLDGDPQRRAEQATRQMMAGDRASAGLGIEIVDVAPGWALARMTVAESMINGHDIGHGGYVFLLADTAFAVACNSDGPVTVAAGADITFVASARLGDELTAEAEERARYGRSGIYDVTVRRGDGAVVAEFRGRSRTLAVTPNDVGQGS